MIGTQLRPMTQLDVDARILAIQAEIKLLEKADTAEDCVENAASILQHCEAIVALAESDIRETSLF